MQRTERNGRIGPYELIRSLGQGGMAEVFLARGPRGGFVAVKRLTAGSGIDGAAMMSREAKLVEGLIHPNVVRTYGFNADEQYIVMEYVPGRTVRDILNRSAERFPLPLDAALSIVHAVAQGLHAAHETHDERGRQLGLVHRDVTPSNILVAVDGTAKLSDFGIAKATLKSDATYGGPLKGKTGYMSPEQCRSEALDRRSDVFSLGAILHELTTGQRLVRGRTGLATMLLTAEGNYPRPRDVRNHYPEQLDAIVSWATACSPDKRYGSARDFGLDLDAFADRYGLELSPRVVLRGLRQLFDVDDEDATELYKDSDAAIARTIPRELMRHVARASTVPIAVRNTVPRLCI